MGEIFEIPPNNVVEKYNDLGRRINDTKFLIKKTDEEMK